MTSKVPVPALNHLNRFLGTILVGLDGRDLECRVSLGWNWGLGCGGSKLDVSSGVGPSV